MVEENKFPKIKKVLSKKKEEISEEKEEEKADL